MPSLFLRLFFGLWLLPILAHAGEVVVVGGSNLPKLDVKTIGRLYTGKTTAISGINLTVINAKNSSPVRGRFLEAYLEQDNDKYEAYWTVRRYIGQGTPPAEVGSTAELFRMIQANPNTIGYIDEAELHSAPQGVAVLARARMNIN